MDSILIVCGRIQSAVGKNALLTHRLLFEQGKSCFFVGLNNSLDYEASTPYDYAVNSRVYRHALLRKKRFSSTGLISLYYKLLEYAFAFFTGEKYHGVVNNRFRLHCTINNVIRKHRINKVVAFYMPTEILEISYNLCRKHGIEFVPLFLDCSKKEQLDVFDDIYSYSEEFLCMPWVLNDEWFIERYSSKIHKINFPIVPWGNDNSIHKTDNTIRFVLFGALYEDIRNPSILFDALIKSNKSFMVNTFCSGCKEILLLYKQKMPDRIEINPIVSEDALHKEIIKSNIVIVIGNTNADQVPSKVFEMLGSGKPFIYLYQNENDLAIPLINKYKLSLVFKYSDIVDNNRFEELFKWCVTNKDMCMSYSDYIINYPEYSIDKYLREIYGN